jgi:hypothetical protein
MVRQVLSGLKQAHDQKIVHRDLKPSNIMLTHAETGVLSAKIIDFGIANFDEDVDPSLAATRTQALIGSPDYMSPEQCRGEKADARSDIYAMGCIMYECVSGKRPFATESVMETMYKQCNEKPASLTAAMDKKTVSVAQVIYQCLEKDAALRPQNASELLVQLEKCFDSSSVFTFQFFRPEGQKKMDKSGRIAALIAILCAAGILVALFVLKAPASKSDFVSSAQSANHREAEHLRNDISRYRSRFEKDRTDEELEHLIDKYGKLSDCYKDDRRMDEALATLEEGLHVCAGESPVRKACQVRLLRSVGDCYKIMNKLDKDYEALHRAYDLSLQSAGKNSTRITNVRYDLMELCMSMGKLEETDTLLAEQAATLRIEIYSVGSLLNYKKAHLQVGKDSSYPVGRMKSLCDSAWDAHRCTKDRKRIISCARIIQNASSLMLDYGPFADSTLVYSKRILAELSAGPDLDELKKNQVQLEQHQHTEQLTEPGENDIRERGLPVRF